MQSQTVLLFLVLCIGEELRTGSLLAVSSPPVTTQRESQGGQQEGMSRENATSVEGIREMQDHSQNIEGPTKTPTPLSELKETDRNGPAIVPGSIAVMRTSMAVIGESVLSEYPPDSSLPTTLTPPGPMRRTVTSEGGALSQQPITTLASTEGDPDTDGSLSQLASSDSPERMRTSGPGPDPPSEASGWSLRLVGAGPRPRRRRSWLWNQFFVIEEYRGPEPVLIGRLHTDMDRGDGLIRYVLEGEGVGSVFVIDEQTGNIHVTKALDREEKDEYRLVATATDRQTGRALEPSSQFLIRVQDINDNPPVFRDGPYSATVPEMANIGTSIIQVTASDADDPTYGNSARLVYAITQGQQHFSVDPQTGVLRTAVPDLDRETQDEYQVILEAKDMGGQLGGLSGTTTVTVRLTDVNDSPPRFRKSAWSFSVSELAAPGVEVGRLLATDADLGENAALEFAILEAEEAGTFNISGRGQEAVIVLNKLLDYESQNSFSFSVEVTNPVVDAHFIRRGPFKDRATVRVMVLNADEPPRFSRARYRLDVSENCPPVCSVGRVSAVDPDTGESANIRYSIDPQSDPEALFRIASDSGFITTVMELDREREQWHNITVIATQRDNPNLVTRVVVAIETLDQNDNAPELDRQYTTSVCDSSSPGQVVQILRAVDKDPGGQDAPIHFSIPPESGSARNLTIRESGGATASLVLRSALRPLSGSSPSLLTLLVPVVLRDGASGLTNTGTVTVTVCPCLGGAMRAEDRGPQQDVGDGGGWERHTVCLPLPTTSPTLVFSVVTLLALLAGAATLLVVCALSLSLRHKKRDSLSSFEEDDVRENIITYDDEGGGEADTAAFDITALQSMQRVQRIQDSRNIWFTQQNPPRARTYSCSRNTPSALNPCRPGSAPLYGRLCYGLHTLPVRRGCQEGPLQAGALQLTKLTYGPPGHLGVGSLMVQNQGAVASLRPGAADINAVTHAGSGGVGPEHPAPTDPPAERQTGYQASFESQQNQNQEAKQDQPGSAMTSEVVIQIDCDPSASSSHSESSTSSSEPESQRGASPTQTTTAASSSALDETDTESSTPSLSEKNERGISQKDRSKNQASLPGDSYSIVGSLNQGGGGIPVTGTTLYSGGAELLNIYKLGRKDLTPQLLPLPGGMLGYGPTWACGRRLVSEGVGPSSDSLPLRMEEFLKFRLHQVTSDLSQPPYDSLQTYEFEGGASRAESLSSLESDGEREEKTAERMDEFGQKFDRLVEIIKEREREKETEREEIKEKALFEETPVEGRGDGEAASQTHGKQSVEIKNEESGWDF